VEAYVFKRQMSQCARALAGRGGPQELLIGMPILGRIALAGRGGLQEQLSGEHVWGSNRLGL
jgi:hypothetical protein